MNGVIIRPETEQDYHGAELAAKLAFWNLHHPGCDEHLLVHKLRKHECYVPELTLVAEYEGEIIGCIYYAEARVGDNPVLTFGPLCVIPKFERRGVGGALLAESLKLARAMFSEDGGSKLAPCEDSRKRYPGIVIYGEPEYYPRFGFKTTDNFGITSSEGGYSPALMGYEFTPGALSAIPGAFREPAPYTDLPADELAAHDARFPYIPKRKRAGQWSD